MSGSHVVVAQTPPAAACCQPSLNAEPGGEIEALRARQENLRTLIAENELAVLGPAGQPHETARK